MKADSRTVCGGRWEAAAWIRPSTFFFFPGFSVPNNATTSIAVLSQVGFHFCGGQSVPHLPPLDRCVTHSSWVSLGRGMDTGSLIDKDCRIRAAFVIPTVHRRSLAQSPPCWFSLRLISVYLSIKVVSWMDSLCWGFGFGLKSRRETFMKEITSKDQGKKDKSKKTRRYSWLRLIGLTSSWLTRLFTKPSPNQFPARN